MTQLLARREITINGNDYVLASREQASKYGLNGRRWQATKVSLTTDIVQKANVRRLATPGEWVVIYDTWDKGMWGDRDVPPGTYHHCEGLETRVPGRLFRSFMQETKTISLATATQGADPVCVIKHKGSIFVLAGRYAFIYDGNYTVSQDLGASAVATDAIVWNDELLVGCGTATFMWKRSAAGVWSQSTATHATYFAAVQDHLWRANDNLVSNLGPTDDPMATAPWSANISVGANARLITDLNALGYRLVVSKEEGLFLGDSSAIFPNVLPDIEMILDSDNGVQSLVKGSEIFYPFAKGLKYYQAGSSPLADEVGPNINFGSSINEDQPGLRVTASVAEGEWVYVATESSMRPWQKPTGFMKTVNNGANYTSYLTEVTDNDNAQSAVLDALSTVANGDWVIVGYSSPFLGLILDLKSININASVMTIQYWNGAAWTAFSTSHNFNTACDYTSYLGKSLQRGEAVIWSRSPTDWAQSTISGTSAYWIRMSFSATLSTTVRVSECRVITDSAVAPTCYILAGRRAGYGDPGSSRYIWYTLARLNVGRVTAINITNAIDGQRGRVLVCASRQIVTHIFMNESAAITPRINSIGAGYLYTGREDAGMPEVNKEWIDVKVKGRHLDADNSWRIWWRTDESATVWTSCSNSAAQIASGTYAFSTRPTGKALQQRIGLGLANVITDDVPVEINHMELRFRELPTYKTEYTALLQLSNKQRSSLGTILSDASTQLTNLENAMGVAIAITDPISRAKTVTLTDIQEIEYIQEGTEYPIMLVQVRMSEL